VAVTSRAGQRKAAIAASLAEFQQERDREEAERLADEKAESEAFERMLRQEQEEIFQRHPPSNYPSLEEWQKALRNASYAFLGEEYQAILRNPDAYFRPYEDEGYGWYSGSNSYRLPGVGAFMNGRFVNEDDVDAELPGVFLRE